jgi:hypothetical protein
MFMPFQRKRVIQTDELLSSVVTLQTQYADLKADVEHLNQQFSTSLSAVNASIQTFKDDFAKSRQVNWGWIFGAIASCAILFGAAFTIAQKDSQILLAPIAAENNVSMKDRDDIRRQLGEHAQQLTKLEAFEAKTGADQREIETQFRWQGSLMNKEHAENERRLAMLWGKVFSEPYPNIEFYPDYQRPDNH